MPRHKRASPVNFWTVKDCHLFGIFGCSGVFKVIGVFLLSCVMQWRDDKAWKWPAKGRVVVKSSFQGRRRVVMAQDTAEPWLCAVQWEGSGEREEKDIKNSVKK